MSVIGAPFGLGSRDLLSGDFITYLQAVAPAGLQLCLDPGDGDCVPSAAAQTIFDLAGGGPDWLLGSSTGGDIYDPAFNGSIDGNADEFYAYGDDDLRALSFPSWIQDEFLEPAGTWSFACAWRSPDAGTGKKYQLVIGENSEYYELEMLRTAAGKFQFLGEAYGEESVIKEHSTTLASDTWYFLGASQDRAGGASASFLQVDTAVETYDGSHALGNYAIDFARFGPSTSGSHHIGPIAMWNRAISQAEMAAVATYLKNRYA